jgi:hypothetical protein
MSLNFENFDTDHDEDGEEDQAGKEAELLAKIRKIKTIKVMGHCVDRSNIVAKDATGKVVFDTEPDYVKSGMGIGQGDVMMLEIDIDTGQIVNWKRPTDDAMLEAFEGPQR